MRRNASTQYNKDSLMRKNKALLKLLSNPQVITRLYSPRISRTIPVPIALSWPRLLNEWTVVGVASGILLFLVVSLGLQVRDQTRELKARQALRQGIQAEISHWQKVTHDYTDYRDGYFRLALLHYQLGETTQAREYVDKSLALDPNFIAGEEFKTKLLEE